MVKHICSQKVGRACRELAQCYSYSGATVSMSENKLNELMSQQSFTDVIVNVDTNDLVYGSENI